MHENFTEAKTKQQKRRGLECIRLLISLIAIQS